MGIRMIMPGIYEFDPDVPDDVEDSERLKTLIRLSNLPLETRYKKRMCAFEIISGRQAAFDSVLALIRGEIFPPLLLLYGLPGRSKTHLAIAAAWSFLAKFNSVLYYHVGDLLDDLRKGMMIHDDSLGSADIILQFAKTCTLLVLDDLGVQKDTDWAVEKLDTIVNSRYDHSLSTLITANTLDIPDRIYDRMCEGKIVKIEGESYRQIIKKRKESTMSKQ